MQPDDRNPAYHWDMLQAARETVDMLDDYDLSAFLADRVMLRATERTIEILGEAARRVSAAFQAVHPEVPGMKSSDNEIFSRMSTARLIMNCCIKPHVKIFQH